MKRHLVKPIVVGLLVGGSLLPASGFSFPSVTRNTNTTIVQNMFSTMMEKDLLESQRLLEMSTELKNASAQLDIAQELHADYLRAMLQLSQDIGVMADRIVVVAQQILHNQTETQQNILEAQRNLGHLIAVLRSQ